MIINNIKNKITTTTNVTTKIGQDEVQIELDGEVTDLMRNAYFNIGQKGKDI